MLVFYFVEQLEGKRLNKFMTFYNVSVILWYFNEKDASLWLYNAV